MSKLYEKLGNDPMTLIMKGVPNSSVLICWSSSYGSLLAIKRRGVTSVNILPEFVDKNTNIVDTTLSERFGWHNNANMRSISNTMQIDLYGYKCWAFNKEEFSYEQVFKTIKDVYDRNTGRSSDTL